MWFSKAMQGFSVRNVWQAAATVFDKSLEARLGSPVTTRSLSPNNSTLASRIDRLLSHKLTANGNNGQTGFLGIFRNTKPKCKSGSDSFLVDAAKIFSGRKNALGRWHISTKTESNIVTRSQAEVELHVLLESRYATLTKSHEYSPHAISIEEVNQFNPDAPAPQQIRTTVTPTGTPTPAAAPANDANGNATQPAAPALVVAPPTALVQEMPWHPPLVIRTASPEQVADVAA
ncbi:MAG TPA: hypothetical protein VFS42_04340, partial [Burkholderiaceae bacterium]|nr:hypothetical protein [Burkholderiaceae bacterium]